MQDRSGTIKNFLQIKDALRQFPISVIATSGDLKGEIDLSWEPVNEASSYLLQKSTSVNKPVKWKYEDVITKSSYTVSNLKSNRSYWFRVAAVTSEGKTNWSRPIKKKAP